MPLVTLPYPNMDFVPLDILTATELDQMVANIEAINSTTAVDSLKNKFAQTVTDSQTFTSGYLGSAVTANGIMNLTQSADSSTFNVYGNLYITRSQSSATNVTLSPIAGLSGSYGIKTTLKLTIPPTTALEFQTVGTNLRTNSDNSNVTGAYQLALAVGTDGYVYLGANTASTLPVASSSQLRWMFYSALYFNTNF